MNFESMLIKEILGLDSDVRWAVARHPSTPVPVLEALARDEAWVVRWAVAENPSTPGAVRWAVAEWIREWTDKNAEVVGNVGVTG